ncbi:GTP-binding protein [uncultured Dokdonia sp.]|uniref:GTP-binding protein n=1 Tax=uncultured Dokdonia sp. TaxID=575653 RepID=UPI00261F67C5|nr:GTP-binding protein [uncultured Dokdonia sp.]
MEFSNDITLRPRFSLELNALPENVLHAFKEVAETQKDFIISRVDDHVFIRIPKHKQHFWSPQLHLEIYKLDQQPTVLKGLFGPKPTVWTLFMFLHFIVATLFISAGIWMYSCIVLKTSFTTPLVLMVLFFILWFVLYFSGRLGKEAGKKEMKMLHYFMYNTLKDYEIIRS